jgi:hypothetical protein
VKDKNGDCLRMGARRRCRAKTVTRLEACPGKVIDVGSAGLKYN